MLFIIIIAVIIVYICKNAEYKKSEYYRQTSTAMFSMMTDKGKHGEYLTYKYLIDIEGYKKFLFNCYIPKENDETTEIDVIMIHETGIYVFESKNYSGWIFGTETNKNWTQTLPGGKGKSHKSHFLNPIIQNKQHIKWLKAYLNTELPMFSFIVFSERCKLKNITLTSNEHYVINRYNVMSAVRNNIAANSAVLSYADVDSLYDRLYALTQVTDDVKIAHIQQIQNINAIHEKKVDIKEPESNDLSADHKSTADKICPRCGAKLVLRTVRKGENAGNQFWGCSSFPKCRFTENVDK